MITFADLRGKGEIIETIQRTLQALLFYQIPPQQRERVLSYLKWMRENGKGLTVQCRFEADGPKSKMTIEMSFPEIGGLSR